MKRSMVILVSVLDLAGVPMCMVGCDREIEHTKSTEIKRDGTVESKEKTVTQNPDGTITEEKSESKTKP